MTLRLLRVVLLSLLLACSSTVFSKDTVVGMSKKVYDGINQIQLLMDAEQWAEAMERMDSWLGRKINNYERAHLLNMKGFAYYQMEDMGAAFQAYQQALSLEGLPESQVRALLTTVSQLALVVENYPAAEKYALQLLASPGKTPPSAFSHVILAQAYLGQEHYQKAVEPLRTALRMQRDAGKLPRENWLTMLSSVYFALEDYNNMREILYQLVSLYPKERYLINLAALHGQLGETDKQLALIESLLDEQRLEREQHLLSLANLFLAHSLPYKAAALLETEMDAGRIEESQRNLELESQAWYMAGEGSRAILPLEQAAAVASNGELYLRVARLYMDTYDWSKAAKAARAAEEKGDLRDPGSALLIEGMALARLEEFDRARKIFKRVIEFEKSRKHAKQWLKFIDGEERRLAAFQL
jgi:tetratricopeptide (TPR) repeat protein